MTIITHRLVFIWIGEEKYCSNIVSISQALFVCTGSRYIFGSSNQSCKCLISEHHGTYEENKELATLRYNLNDFSSVITF